MIICIDDQHYCIDGVAHDWIYLEKVIINGSQIIYTEKYRKISIDGFFSHISQHLQAMAKKEKELIEK